MLVCTSLTKPARQVQLFRSKIQTEACGKSGGGYLSGKMEVVEMLQQNDAHDVAAEVEVAVSQTSEMPKQKMKGSSAVLQHCLGTSSSCNNEEV